MVVWMLTQGSGCRPLRRLCRKKRKVQVAACTCMYLHIAASNPPVSALFMHPIESLKSGRRVDAVHTLSRPAVEGRVRACLFRLINALMGDPIWRFSRRPVRQGCLVCVKSTHPQDFRPQQAGFLPRKFAKIAKRPAVVRLLLFGGYSVRGV